MNDKPHRRKALEKNFCNVPLMAAASDTAGQMMIGLCLKLLHDWRCFELSVKGGTIRDLGWVTRGQKKARVGPTVWAPVQPRILVSRCLALCEGK